MSLTTFPDLSAFQAGLSIKGVPFVVARATEGNWLRDAAFHGFREQAAKLGIPCNCYHFLEAGSSAESQARFCHAVAGKTPLMLDFEPIIASASAAAMAVDDPGSMGQYCGSAWQAIQEWRASLPAEALATTTAAPFVSKPGLDKAASFIDHYRDLGGVIHALYFPHWYWQILGSQSLERFAKRDIFLVSSSYTAYSSDGPGWDAYGGMKPRVWQFSDTHALNGRKVDYNAFKGTAAELARLFATGSATAELNPVKNLHASPRYTQIDVSWKAAPRSCDYHVKAWVGDTREVATQVLTGETKVTLHGLKKGTRYRVSVWAQPGSGETASVYATTKKA